MKGHGKLVRVFCHQKMTYLQLVRAIVHQKSRQAFKSLEPVVLASNSLDEVLFGMHEKRRAKFKGSL